MKYSIIDSSYCVLHFLAVVRAHKHAHKEDADVQRASVSQRGRGERERQALENEEENETYEGSFLLETSCTCCEPRAVKLDQVYRKFKCFTISLT